MAQKRKNKTLRKSKLTIARIDECLGMLAAQVPRTTMKKNLAQKWGIKPWRVDEYIDEAYDYLMIPARDAAWQEKTRARMRLGFESIFMQAMARKNGRQQSDPDFAAAIRALREIGKLDDAYLAGKAEEDKGSGIQKDFNMTNMGFKDPESLRARIQELRDKLGKPGGAKALAEEAEKRKKALEDAAEEKAKAAAQSS